MRDVTAPSGPGGAPTLPPAVPPSSTPKSVVPDRNVVTPISVNDKAVVQADNQATHPAATANAVSLPTLPPSPPPPPQPMSRTRQAIHDGLMMSHPNPDHPDIHFAARKKAAFDDGPKLEAVQTTGHPSADPDFVNVVSSMLRADLAGIKPGSFLAYYNAASEADKANIRLAVGHAYEHEDLCKFVEASPERKQAALKLSLAMGTPDPAAGMNEAALARMAKIKDWTKWPNQLIIVTGYTPLAETVAKPGVHPVAKERLQEAVRAYRDGQAPFIMVSGANVYPAGTPYFEGIEMKKELLKMGVPEEAIVVEARARHSTTNLRNAGRFMLEHGMTQAMICPEGGGIKGSHVFDQAFYFSNPTLSTFNARCKRELGYKVGDLEGITAERVSFTPSKDVKQLSYRDPLDP